MGDRTVFVLDVSGSMAGTKCNTLNLETIRFIERIADGNYVGIVLFSGKAWTVHEVTRITGRDIRNSLIDKVPKYGTGSTDIRAGIMEALAAFRRANVQTAGAKIFLATDGGHCCGNPDYVGDVLPHLRDAKVSVICVAIGVSADPLLERLTTETKGRVYNLSRVDAENREMMARIMDTAMREVSTSKEMALVVATSVCNEIVTIGADRDSRECRVVIDRDIGRNTQIQVRSENIDSIDVTVTSPTGAIYNTAGGQVSKSSSLKHCQLFIETTEPGVWAITLTKQTTNTVRAHLLVESEPTGAHAIELAVHLRAPDPDCPPIIACTLRKGVEPVVGALLTATVDRPDGLQTDLSLDKYYHNEGYYYNYFTEYSGPGRYNVSVLAVSDGNNTTYRGSATGEFRRQLVSDSFQVKPDSMPSRPPTDDHFQQLLLAKQFADMRLNGGAQPAPAPGPAPGPVPKPAPRSGSNATTSSGLLSSPMKAKKQQLSVNYIKCTRAINSSKLPENELKKLLKSIADFERYLSSPVETTVAEIERYQRKLDEVTEVIKQAKSC